MNTENTLFDFADIASFLMRTKGLPPEVEKHLRAGVICGVKDWLSKFESEKESVPEPESHRASPGEVVAEPHRKEAVEKTPKEAERKAEEKVKEEAQVKRRGRPKKKAFEEPEEPEEPQEEIKEETSITQHREIRFGEGLDKELVSFSTIEDVNDDKIVNENLGPIPLANSLPKVGEHPFFKGPAQFVWYLDMDRWPLYLADLLETKEFYPDQLSLYDTKRLEEVKRVGVDIEFVASIVNKDTKRLVSIEDFDEKDYADNDEGIEKLMELKESGFLKKFVKDVDPDKTLIKFLCRNGKNKHIADDLQTIYEEHTEHPNKYIHW